MRTIEYTVNANCAALPDEPQYGGVQGEHNATTVIFNVSEIAREGTYWRVEWINGAGEFGSSPLLDGSGGVIAYNLTDEITRGGIKVTLTLIQALVNENNAEQVICAVPVLIFLTPSGVDENSAAGYKRGLTGLMLEASEAATAAKNSQAAAEAAKSDADSAAYAAGQFSATAAEASEVAKSAANASQQSAEQAKQDVDAAVSAHNYDTSAHSTLIESAVETAVNAADYLISAHNSNPTAHTDIQSRLSTTESGIDAIINHTVPDSISAHNSNPTAHTDIQSRLSTAESGIDAIINHTVPDSISAHNSDASAHSALIGSAVGAAVNAADEHISAHDSASDAHAELFAQKVGVPADWHLINTVTIEEDGVHQINITGLKLKCVHIYAYFPADTAAKIIEGYITVNTYYSMANLYTASGINTSARYFFAHAEKHRGMWSDVWKSLQTVNNKDANVSKTFFNYADLFSDNYFNKPITGIKLYAGLSSSTTTYFPIGTKVTIYGVTEDEN